MLKKALKISTSILPPIPILIMLGGWVSGLMQVFIAALLHESPITASLLENGFI